MTNYEKIAIEEIVAEVEYQKYLFYEKYNRTPNFIKIPIWIYNGIIAKSSNYVVHHIDGHNTFCGLILCPTVSIEKPDEIEVF